MSISAIYEELLLKAGTGSLSELFSLLLRLSKALGNQQLEKWVLLELNGYYNTNPALTEDVVVPAYRTVAGQRSDGAGRLFVVTDPKLLVINENRLRNGISELELLLKSEEQISFRDPYASKIINQYYPNVVVEIFSFSPVLISGVLSGIRSKMIEWLHNIEPDVQKMDNNSFKSNSVDVQSTEVDKKSKTIKNNPILSTIILIGIIVMGFGAFTNSIKDIHNFCKEYLFGKEKEDSTMSTIGVKLDPKTLVDDPKLSSTTISDKIDPLNTMKIKPQIMDTSNIINGKKPRN